MATETRPNVSRELTGFFEKNSDPLILIDDDRRIIGLNPAAEDLTGWQSQYVAGVHTCSELFNCKDETGAPLTGAECPGRCLFDTGQTTCTADYTIRRPGGERIKVVSKYNVVQQPLNGHRVGLIRMNARAGPRARPAKKAREAAALLTIALTWLFVIVALQPYPDHRYRWAEVGSMAAVVSDAPQAFALATAVVEPGTPIISQRTVFVTAPRGEAATVLEGNCPADGAAFRWNGKLDRFRCPQCQSAFSRQGAWISGPAEAQLEKLKAHVEAGVIHARIPTGPQA